MYKTTVTVTEYNPAGDITKVTETVEEYDDPTPPRFSLGGYVKSGPNTTLRS